MLVPVGSLKALAAAIEKALDRSLEPAKNKNPNPEGMIYWARAKIWPRVSFF